MKIKKFVGGFLYQPGNIETTYYWIKNLGGVDLIEDNRFKKEVPKETIPDIVYLAIKTGAYEEIDRIPR